MENLQVSDFTNTYILGVCILVCAIYYHQLKKKWYFHRIDIPYTFSWPLLGSLPTAMRKGILEHDIDSIKQYGRVHGTFLGNHPNMVVADPDYIKEIFINQFHKFPHRMQALYISDWWQNSVVMASGNHWRYMRSVITPAFSSIKMRQIQPQLTDKLNTITGCLGRMTDRLQGDAMDVRHVLSALTMDIFCSTSFGHEMNTLEYLDNEFSRHAKIVSTLNIESNPLNGLPLIMPCIKRLFKLLDLDYVDKNSLSYIKDFVQDLINKRRDDDSENKNTNDILDSLMKAHEESQVDLNNNEPECSSYKQFKERGLSDDELIANTIVVLMAGSDTTATTMTWMCYLLATNQHVQEKLLQVIDEEVGDEEPVYENVMHIDYLDWFLSETLRLYPAANRTGRDAIVDTEVCGVTVPEGLSITVPIYAIHRMAEYWPQPDKCIPERFAPENKDQIRPYTYLPFGAGPRVCLGVRMAQMLCKVIMVKLLQNFKFEVADSTEMCPVLEASLLTKPKNGMNLKLVRRR